MIHFHKIFISGDTQNLVMIGIIIRNIKQQTCLLKTQSKSPKWLGTYKCKWEKKDSDYPVTSAATMKINADGTFELIDEWVSWDVFGTTFYAGNWEIKQDTLICRVVPELMPSTVQERYPGQILRFVWANFEDNKQYIMEEGKVYKFLVRKKGLIRTDIQDYIYKKVKNR